MIETNALPLCQATGDSNLALSISKLILFHTSQQLTAAACKLSALNEVSINENG